MIDFAQARTAMVDGQVRASDVTDPRIHQAMLEIPRELFVPKGKRSLAYIGEAVGIGEDRYLMDPRNFALLVQALDIRPTDLVLDIGCGTGYSTAVLAQLAETVVALESDEALAAGADQAIQDLGIDNAAVVKGDLAAGYAGQGPYDVIFVGGGVETVPEAWKTQLTEGGRLGVIVLGHRVGKGTIFIHAQGSVSERIVFDGTVPALPGFNRAEEFVF